MGGGQLSGLFPMRAVLPLSCFSEYLIIQQREENKMVGEELLTLTQVSCRGSEVTLVAVG